MAKADKTQDKNKTVAPQRRITYTRQNGGLCEVELNMTIKHDGSTLERSTRIKRDSISRYYSDSNPSRSIIETEKGEKISVILPFSTLCKRLDGAYLTGKRLINLSDVTGRDAEEREAKAQLAKLFNAEAVIADIPDGDTLVIAYGYTTKKEIRKYMMVGFLKSEILEIKSDSSGTYAAMDNWDKYCNEWGMTTNYGPFISNIDTKNLRTALNDAVSQGTKLTDLRKQTAIPTKAKLITGLKLSPKAAGICQKAL